MKMYVKKNYMSHLRYIKGLTQKQLADKIGVSATAICHYEKGDRKIPYNIAEQIAQILDTTSKELLWIISEEVETCSKTLGQQIMQARKRAGLTQNQLGKLCGINPSYICYYEQGLKHPKSKHLLKISKILHMDIELDIEEEKDVINKYLKFDISLFTDEDVQYLNKCYDYIMSKTK